MADQVGSPAGTFLSHNSDHKPAVREIAKRLRAEGIDVWLDEWNLIPGQPWQVAIGEALRNCRSCVVFVGPGGLGPWQHEEMRAAIDRRVNEADGSRVIPLLLPGADRPNVAGCPRFWLSRPGSNSAGILMRKRPSGAWCAGFVESNPAPAPMTFLSGVPVPIAG
jgi:hypothetical protein